MYRAVNAETLIVSYEMQEKRFPVQEHLCYLLMLWEVDSTYVNIELWKHVCRQVQDLKIA